MRLCYMLLLFTLTLSGILSVAAVSESTSISKEASPNPIRSIGSGNKRILRAQGEAEDEERRFNFLSPLKNSFKKSSKKTKSSAAAAAKNKELLSKELLPSAHQLNMMSYRDDIAYPFFKSWTDLKLPLPIVTNIVNGDEKIIKSFMGYQVTLNAAKAAKAAR
ncbi:hypothetical protein PHYBOEH_000261 [Phytophthora boehmeriae]|uniref:RxLR effector protein n=1 Tax=Phytophthora boehmeriae TaxID=109152 RepID=A0A8T1WUA5_9STRA|nr:hypothetical protein PHYBOEH_000261 [Phytophthora boehmeriae]